MGGKTYGVAKSVNLVSVKVLNDSGSGTMAGVIAGINWVSENASGDSVANMSLGGGFSSAVNEAVDNLVNPPVDSLGVPVFTSVSAGNEDTLACNKSPASAAEAYTVGSTTSSDERSSFSNFGSCVNIFAPGSSITSIGGTWSGTVS